jgi:hypothetical protein
VNAGRSHQLQHAGAPGGAATSFGAPIVGLVALNRNRSPTRTGTRPCQVGHHLREHEVTDQVCKEQIDEQPEIVTDTDLKTKNR